MPALLIPLLGTTRRWGVSEADSKGLSTQDWVESATICPPPAVVTVVGTAGYEPVPGYVLQRELGRGGMGVVYLARQEALNRPVALKMILSGAHAGAGELGRFRAEA